MRCTPLIRRRWCRHQSPRPPYHHDQSRNTIIPCTYVPLLYSADFRAFRRNMQLIFASGVAVKGVPCQQLQCSESWICALFRIWRARPRTAWCSIWLISQHSHKDDLILSQRSTTQSRNPNRDMTRHSNPKQCASSTCRLHPAAYKCSLEVSPSH